MNIQYPKYEMPEGGDFLKLKELLQKEGDEVRMKLIKGRVVPGSETQFGTTSLELTVAMRDDNGDKVQKVFNTDAPDPKNDGQGSQVYRGMADNNIQPGDVFKIAHGGQMNNKYKTTIYTVIKEEAGKDTEEQMTPEEVEKVMNSDEEVRVEDIDI